LLNDNEIWEKVKALQGVILYTYTELEVKDNLTALISKKSTGSKIVGKKV